LTKRLGPRFGLEAGFLVGVAVVLGLLEVSWPSIVAAMAIAWLVVAGSEVVLARRQRGDTPTPTAPPIAPVASVAAPPEPRIEAEPEEPEPAPAPASASDSQSEPPVVREAPVASPPREPRE
jgi:hypothetical protein